MEHFPILNFISECRPHRYSIIRKAADVWVWRCSQCSVEIRTWSPRSGSGRGHQPHQPTQARLHEPKVLTPGLVLSMVEKGYWIRDIARQFGTHDKYVLAQLNAARRDRTREAINQGGE